MSAETIAWPDTATHADAKPARQPAMHMRYPATTAAAQNMNVMIVATGTGTERNDNMRLRRFFYCLSTTTAGKTDMVRVK